MGLFVSNKSHEGTKEVTNYEIKQIGTSKLLFDFNKDCTFKHGDKITNLIKARIIEEYEKNMSIAPDSAKYICFEIPTYISVEELAENKIFDTLNQIGKFDDLMKNNYNNMGLIDKKQEDNYELYNPTSEVLSYTRDVLDKQIEDKDYKLKSRIKKGFREQLAETTKEYLKEAQKIKQERKKEIFLKEQFRYRIGKTVYTNYKGVDTVDGKIININRLGEIKQVEDETLYSAFLQKIENTEPIELKTLQGLPSGLPVLFTSQIKMEEIIKNGDKEQIKKFLDLISDIPKDRINTNEMNYIGELDKEGKIIRTDENCSKEIIDKIKDEKEKYKRERVKNIIEERDVR